MKVCALQRVVRQLRTFVTYGAGSTLAGRLSLTWRG